MSSTLFHSTKFQVGGEKISGYSFGDAPSPDFLMLHGGLKPASNYFYLAEKLHSMNISSFAFDHSGHGQSTGQLNQSSLKKRVNEAHEAVKAASFSQPVSIFSYSMGGYVAIKLINHIKIDKLVLLCPGIYDRDAYELKFDSGFTEVIRKEESWKNSDAYELLESFKGKLLVFIGEDDEVIPNGVIKLIKKHSLNTTKSEFVYLPNCPHNVSQWMQDDPKRLDRISKKIVEF